MIALNGKLYRTAHTLKLETIPRNQRVATAHKLKENDSSETIELNEKFVSIHTRDTKSSLKL